MTREGGLKDLTTREQKNLDIYFTTFRWAFFQVATNHEIEDKLQARAAGMLEGSMTAHLIDMQWQNTLADYCAEEADFCFSLGQFLGENLSWMKYQIQNNPEDVYWHQVFESNNFKCGCISCRRKQTVRFRGVRFTRELRRKIQ